MRDRASSIIATLPASVPSSRYAAPSRTEQYLAGELQHHKDAVGIRHVVPERRTLREPVLSIERPRAVEVRPRAGLKAESRHPTLPRRVDDVSQHAAANACATTDLGGVHRFDFAMHRGEPLQRANR